MRFLKEKLDNDFEDIEYEFDLERPVGTPDYWSGDTTEKIEHVTYTYSIPKEDIKDFLYDILDNTIQVEDLVKYIEDNYNKLFEENFDKIKDYFEDKAREEAYEWAD